VPTSAAQRSADAARATARRLAAGRLEPIADAVWRLRGGVPRTMNAYLVQDDGGGVTLFDTGTRAMAGALRESAEALGGINRVVLSHAHVDHRGGAPALGLPVLVHPAEVADAEGDAGLHYMHLDRLRAPARWVYPALRRSWDGGPVAVGGTVEEGEEIAGFRVVAVTGHAPGQIGLFRERDGIVLAADAFTTLDVETSRPTRPRLPHTAFNESDEVARASLLALAALEPRAAWPGHGEPVEGDVRAQLERAAG
jgi:glyoxylase-like metal-dependent hydrolase (beta-lactamase superfamily II)